MPFEASQPNLIDLGYLLAEASRNVVFVVGAGLSVPAKVPAWQPLCDRYLQPELERYLGNDFAGPDIDAEAILSKSRGLSDLWYRGDLYEESLPLDRYQSVVKGALSHHHVPESYYYLWAFQPSGVIDFCLDDCARLALGGMGTQVATSGDPDKYRSFLLQTRPFLLHPHGIVHRPDTWILGAKRRNKLLKDQYYRKFIMQLLGSRRLVILGFQPEDFALQSLLVDDFRDGFGGLDHFWITHKFGPEQEAFARLYNLKPIHYTPRDDSHPEVTEILEALSDFRPRESNAPFAYSGIPMDPLELPAESELRREEPESIRSKLNAALMGVALDLAPAELGPAIQKFLDDHKGSVRLAWTVAPNAPYDRVCGFKVLEPLGEGAFSSVWRVENPVDGAQFALKVMREDLISDRERFDAFRRGVRAMEILAERRSDGMIRFERAFEVPAAVVMEFIDGETLDAALAGRQINSVHEALSIVHRVAGIVSFAHNLPERVMHRDIKPSNVMIRHGNRDQDIRSRVVVLDFDLSWYEGAFGRSTLAGAQLNNYLAPEQVIKSNKYSSHHTAVDVFGLGMLLYHVATGLEPRLNLQDTMGFESAIPHAVNHRWRTRFRATPFYLMQLIKAATVTPQDQRVGLPVLLNALRELISAEANGTIEAGSAFGAIEIALQMEDAAWMIDMGELGTPTITARSKAGSGRVTVSPAPGVNSGESWQVAVEYVDEGMTARRSVDRYLGSRVAQASALLRRDGLYRVSEGARGGTATVVGVASAETVSEGDVKRLGRALAEAAAVLTLA